MADQPTFPDLIPGILPFGSICLLSGPPHRGKTALLASLLARLVNGETLFGLPTTPPPAIGFICTDHKHQLNQSQWLSRAGIVDRIKLYSLRNDLDFNWQRLGEKKQRSTAFEDSVEYLKLPEGSLLVVDPVALFISSQLNDYHSVAMGLGQLDQILQRRNLTMWGTAHTAKQTLDTKKTYARPIDRINGSGAQIGFADTAMALTGPEDTTSGCYELAVSPAMTTEFTYYYQRDTQGLFVPGTPMQDVGTDTRLVPSDMIYTALLDAVALTEHAEGIIAIDLWRRMAGIDETHMPFSRATFYRGVSSLEHRQMIVTDAITGRILPTRTN